METEEGTFLLARLETAVGRKEYLKNSGGQESTHWINRAPLWGREREIGSESEEPTQNVMGFNHDIQYKETIFFASVSVCSLLSPITARCEEESLCKLLHMDLYIESIRSLTVLDNVTVCGVMSYEVDAVINYAPPTLLTKDL